MAGLIDRIYPEDPREIQARKTLDSDTPLVNTIGRWQPLRWLGEGWRDLWHAPSALLYGVVVAGIGLLAVGLTWSRPWLSFALVSGFLIVAPVLAAGVNELARRLEAGERSGLASSLDVVSRLGAPLWAFAATLAVLFCIWAGFAWLWIGVMNVGSVGVLGSLDQMVIAMLSSTAGIVSLAGVVLAGALFALGAFAVSVVTMPALLDRRCSLVDAVAISLKVFRDNRLPMLFWAALITALFGVSLLTAFVALVVVFPWLGFAMWHGYRDMVVRERTGT